MRTSTNRRHNSGVLAANLGRLLVVAFATIAVAGNANAATYVDLGGPATGFLSVTSFKTSTTQNGIEGKDVNGDPDPGHNGLPDYPNFEVPAGSPSEGVYSAIIASPQSTTNDYSVLSTFYNDSPLAINNQAITQSDFATMSAGHIHYDNSLVTGSGTEIVPVSQLTFGFDIFEWDGVTTGDGGPTTVPNTPTFISPFSPIYTEYNDAGGFGNAQLWYNMSVDNVTGAGLTFQDGDLTSMDIQSDLTVDLTVAFFPTTSASFSGTFSASGLSYDFDVSDTQGLLVFSGIHMYMNRAGTASLAVPEPSAAVLLGLCAMGLKRRRHRRS